MALDNEGLVCFICEQPFETGVLGVRIQKGDMAFNTFNKLVNANDLRVHAECLTEYDENKYVQTRFFR